MQYDRGPVSVFWFRGPKYSTKSRVTKVLGNGGIGTGVLEAVNDCMLPIPEPQQPNSGCQLIVDSVTSS